jgi:hypothetical protein
MTFWPLDGLLWLHFQLAGSMGATCHPQRALAPSRSSSTTSACTTFPLCIRIRVLSVFSVSRPVVVLSCHYLLPRCLAADCLVYVNRCPKFRPELPGGMCLPIPCPSITLEWAQVVALAATAQLPLLRTTAVRGYLLPCHPTAKCYCFRPETPLGVHRCWPAGFASPRALFPTGNPSWGPPVLARGVYFPAGTWGHRRAPLKCRCPASPSLFGPIVPLGW